MRAFKMQGAYGKFDAFFYAFVVAPYLLVGLERFVQEGVPQPLGPATIVDVGCGAGQLAALLARRYPQCEVLGIDLSPDMIRWARRSSPAQPNLRFEIGDALDLHLPAAYADIVTCVTSLKHWPDKGRGLREILRVLKPGGTLCLIEADPECSLDAARRFVARWHRLLTPLSGLLARYFRRFVARGGLPLSELQALASDIGFVDLYPLREEVPPAVYLRARRPG